MVRKPRRNREEIRAQTEVLLQSGFPRRWDLLAEQFGLPVTSYRRYMDQELPDLGIEPEEVAAFAEIAKALKAGPKTVLELANELDCGPSTIEDRVRAMKESSLYDIKERQQKVLLQKPEQADRPDIGLIWPGGGEFSIALASDFHIGSIYYQATALDHYANTAVDDGCAHCLVAGDITAGTYPRRDRTEIYAYGADEQVDAVCDTLPEVEGLTWYLQGGNHDMTHYRGGGTNVVRRICTLRDDCVYAGFTKSDIPLTPLWKIRLWHPRGGKPYSKSYRGQKGAEVAAYDWLTEAVTEEEAKAIIILEWGHVHYRDLFWYGPMMVINPGCFQAEYEWLAAGAMAPEIAGVILKLRVSPGGWGSVSEFKWLAYKAAEDDYRPVRHRGIMQTEITESLFSLGGK